MAAVTVNTSFQTNVIGHLRQNNYNIDIAADADFLDVPMRNLNYATVISNTNNAIGYTAAASTIGTRITFQTGGAETGSHVSAVGN
tara:strand:+ start:768 stop:1025 length:258 start_codon:yes stop_codon:yes gene_type:complete